jgi:RNA polymerase sigma factor (sigma-70 family)
MLREELFLNKLKAATPKLKETSLYLTTKDDSDLQDDLLQDTLLAILENYDKFDGRNMLAWGNTIMKNLYINMKNKKRSARNYEALELVYPRVSINNGEELLVMRQIEDALSVLTPRSKQIIRMSCVDGMKFSEIADELGISIVTARVIHSVNIKKIKKGLLEYK